MNNKKAIPGIDGEKEVTKDEYVAYIKSYPRKLERDANAVYDPVLITWNDFTLGIWPESVVAWCKGERDGSYTDFHIEAHLTSTSS